MSTRTVDGEHQEDQSEDEEELYDDTIHNRRRSSQSRTNSRRTVGTAAIQHLQARTAARAKRGAADSAAAAAEVPAMALTGRGGRKSGTGSASTTQVSMVVEPVSPIKKRLRQMWTFAAVCQFLCTFQSAFGMDGFETEVGFDLFFVFVATADANVVDLVGIDT